METSQIIPAYNFTKHHISTRAAHIAKAWWNAVEGTGAFHPLSIFLPSLTLWEIEEDLTTIQVFLRSPKTFDDESHLFFLPTEGFWCDTTLSTLLSHETLAYREIKTWSTLGEIRYKRGPDDIWLPFEEFLSSPPHPNTLLYPATLYTASISSASAREIILLRPSHVFVE